MEHDNHLLSGSRRALKLGGLVGRVGSSLLVDRVLGLLGGKEAVTERRHQNLIRNAERIVVALSQLKGGAMKLGQMASLYEGFLPDEITIALRALQSQSRPVPSEIMRFEVEGAFEADIDELFSEWEDEAFAAASIGQVHLARLANGHRVAVKVQYPEVEKMVRADLSNLKLLMTSAVGLLSDMDPEPLWRELNDRLEEELDYEGEADRLRRMGALWADDQRIILPRVIDELSCKTVLSMSYEPGLSPDVACSETQDQDTKDLWGENLFAFEVRSLFEHRVVHADPNMANFGFRSDGRLVIYDLGCVKEVPQRLTAGYAGIVLAVLDGEIERIPPTLKSMGLHKSDGSLLPLWIVERYIEVFGDVLATPNYRFHTDPALYQKLVDTGFEAIGEISDFVVPADMMFVDRMLGGMWANLIRLQAAADWRGILEPLVEPWRGQALELIEE